MSAPPPIPVRPTAHPTISPANATYRSMCTPRILLSTIAPFDALALLCGMRAPTSSLCRVEHSDDSGRRHAVRIDSHESGKIAQRCVARTERSAPTVPPGLPALAPDLEPSSRSIDGEVKSRHETVPVEQGHDEIPPPRRLRHVDLEPEVESPQRRGPIAVTDEVVEWREQRRARFELASFDALQAGNVIDVDAPVALDAEIHRDNRPVGLEVLPDTVESRVAGSQEMLAHLLGCCDAERAQRAYGCSANGIVPFRNVRDRCAEPSIGKRPSTSAAVAGRWNNLPA